MEQSLTEERELRAAAVESIKMFKLWESPELATSLIKNSKVDPALILVGEPVSIGDYHFLKSKHGLLPVSPADVELIDFVLDLGDEVCYSDVPEHRQLQMIQLINRGIFYCLNNVDAPLYRDDLIVVPNYNNDLKMTFASPTFMMFTVVSKILGKKEFHLDVFAIPLLNFIDGQRTFDEIIDLATDFCLNDEWTRKYFLEDTEKEAFDDEEIKRLKACLRVSLVQEILLQGLGHLDFKETFNKSMYNK